MTSKYECVFLQMCSIFLSSFHLLLLIPGTLENPLADAMRFFFL